MQGQIKVIEKSVSQNCKDNNFLNSMYSPPKLVSIGRSTLGLPMSSHSYNHLRRF